MKTMRTSLWALTGRYMRIFYLMRRSFPVEWISFLVGVAFQFLGVFLFWYSLRETGIAFEGWSFTDIVLLQGLYFLSKAASIFSFGYRDLEFKIIDGSFDTYLIRPRSPFVLLSLERLNSVLLFFNLLVGGALLAYGVWQLSLPLWKGVAALGIAALGAISVELLYMTASLLSFRFGRIYYARELLFSFKDAAKYPTDVYPSPMQSVLTYLLPIALIATVPTKLLIGARSDWLRVFGIAASVAAVQWGLYCAVRRWALRRYSSTGN